MVDVVVEGVKLVDHCPLGQLLENLLLEQILKNLLHEYHLHGHLHCVVGVFGTVDVPSQTQTVLTEHVSLLFFYLLQSLFRMS